MKLERIVFCITKGLLCRNALLYNGSYRYRVEANIRVGDNCAVAPIDSNGHEFITIGRDESKPIIMIVGNVRIELNSVMLKI